MIKKIKLILASVVATAMIALPVLMPAAVAAQGLGEALTGNQNGSPSIKDGLCQGANLQVSDGTCQTDTGGETTKRVNDTITLVINIFSIVVGVAAVIMIIIGGLRYIISGGDSGNVTSAKNTILYAIIGLVVVALAQFVVKFVLAKINP